MLANTLIVLLTVVLMEVFSIVAHKYVMHGFGWGWHKSHHEAHGPLRHGSPRGWFEKNDLYAVVFAGVATALIWFSTEGAWPLQWIGAGMTAYGFLYFVAHDGLVHRRWPFTWTPRSGYLKRLYQAHRMHHAVDGKDGAVSFGFLYAPPVATLKRQLHALHGRRPGRRPDAATAPRDEAASQHHAN